MLTAQNHPQESKRIAAVKRLKLLDTASEERFDRITRRAIEELQVPISTITLIDEEREWFKSCQGLPEPEGPRATSFCGHALLSRDMFIIEDATKDPRFSDNPSVIGPPHVRFYAGMALYDEKTKLPVGVFCVKDTSPRIFSMRELEIFIELARLAEEELSASPLTEQK